MYSNQDIKLCMISGSFEYDSEESLSIFQSHIESTQPVKCTTISFMSEDDNIPLLEIENADVLLVFSRRLNTSGSELDRFKNYCHAGKPLVGVRTASHAFENWLGFDKEILGGNYNSHFGVGPQVRVESTKSGENHPILKNVSSLNSVGSLYRNRGISDDCTVLLNGTTNDSTEPVAWTRPNKGGRIFYTSLGHQSDFSNKHFLNLLTNGVLWASRLI